MSRTPLEARRGELLIQAHANGKANTPLHVFRDVPGSAPQFVYADTINPTASAARLRFRVAVSDVVGRDVSADVDAMCLELGAKIDQAQTAAGSGKPGVAKEPTEDPWPEPVDGAALFADLCRHKRRYVVLSAHEINALTAWTFHTYVTDVSDFTPYPWPNSPVRGCGKSTLLETESHLVHRPQLTSAITAAAIARRIDRLQPTMLLDEMDTQLSGERGEALRGILNSGFHRTGKYTVCQGDENEDRDFNTYCAKMIAGIGRLWDTVESRAIPIRMERASPAEIKQLTKIRGDKIHDQCAPFRRKLLRWANDTREQLRDAEPEVPDVLDGRRADVWRPLLAIGEALSDEIATQLREAALAIHNAQGETDYALLLLADLRDLFAEHNNPATMFTAAIVASLLTRDDRPWPELKRGDKAMSGRNVARLLGRFHTQGDPAKTAGPIKPHTIRTGNEVAKGYRLSDLQPAFLRYLAPLGGSLNCPLQALQTAAALETEPPVTLVTAHSASPIGAVVSANRPPDDDEYAKQERLGMVDG